MITTKSFVRRWNNPFLRIQVLHRYPSPRGTLIFTNFVFVTTFAIPSCIFRYSSKGPLNNPWTWIRMHLLLQSTDATEKIVVPL